MAPILGAALARQAESDIAPFGGIEDGYDDDSEYNSDSVDDGGKERRGERERVRGRTKKRKVAKILESK